MLIQYSRSKMEPITSDNSKQFHIGKHVFEHMEIPFPKYSTASPKSTSPTKINIISANIPLTYSRIMNLVFLSLGSTLNLLIILVIVSKSSMRTSSNLYIVSLACSNMVILLEPLEEVLKWFFDIKMKLNMDYVCLINFDVSIITIAILKFMHYVDIFQHQLPFGRILEQKYTAIKAVCLIWVSCTVSIAIGLHIFDFFEGDMADIYVCITFMFIVMPFIICMVLDWLIIYELMILKAIEGSWRSKELRHYCMLVIIAIVFFLIRTPYRIARAINFIAPKALCCTDGKREILYFIGKTFPIVFAIIYISSCAEFRKTLKEILRCQCQSSEETGVDVIV